MRGGHLVVQKEDGDKKLRLLNRAYQEGEGSSSEPGRGGATTTRGCSYLSAFAWRPAAPAVRLFLEALETVFWTDEAAVKTGPSRQTVRQAYNILLTGCIDVDLVKSVVHRLDKALAGHKSAKGLPSKFRRSSHRLTCANRFQRLQPNVSGDVSARWGRLGSSGAKLLSSEAQSSCTRSSKIKRLHRALPRRKDNAGQRCTHLFRARPSSSNKLLRNKVRRAPCCLHRCTLC